MKIEIEVTNPKAIRNLKEFKRQVEESLLLFDDVKVLMPPYLRTLSKEEAIEFAKKYLAERKKDSTTEAMPIDLTPFRDFLHTERAWDLAVEYILEDIIPYLYGEALD